MSNVIFKQLDQVLGTHTAPVNFDANERTNIFEEIFILIF